MWGKVLCHKAKKSLSYWTMFESLDRLPFLSLGRLWLRRQSGSRTGCAAVLWMYGGSSMASDRLQRTSSWDVPALLELLLSHAGLGCSQVGGTPDPSTEAPWILHPSRDRHRHRSETGHPDSMQRYRLLLKSRQRSSQQHLHSGSGSSSLCHSKRIEQTH